MYPKLFPQFPQRAVNRKQKGFGVAWHFLRLHMPLGWTSWGSTGRKRVGHSGRASWPNIGLQPRLLAFARTSLRLPGAAEARRSASIELTQGG